MALRVAPQPGGKVLVILPGNTAGPGGFVTAEEFRGVTTLPAIPKEASLMGKGGLLALNGERKINVQSRPGHTRFTVTLPVVGVEVGDMDPRGERTSTDG